MKFILPILCFALFGFHLDAFACTTILAGKKNHRGWLGAEFAHL
jgi:hypothetical protein